jgi:hypothetical protein
MPEMWKKKQYNKQVLNGSIYSHVKSWSHKKSSLVCLYTQPLIIIIHTTTLNPKMSYIYIHQRARGPKFTPRCMDTNLWKRLVQAASTKLMYFLSRDVDRSSSTSCMPAAANFPDSRIPLTDPYMQVIITTHCLTQHLPKIEVCNLTIPSTRDKYHARLNVTRNFPPPLHIPGTYLINIILPVNCVHIIRCFTI